MNLLLALAFATAAPLDTATFAGGCFWSMERAFDQVDGVVSVTVGYTGGHTTHPSYEQVSTGLTGHLESVQVVFDPQDHVRAAGGRVLARHRSDPGRRPVLRPRR